MSKPNYRIDGSPLYMISLTECEVDNENVFASLLSAKLALRKIMREEIDSLVDQLHDITKLDESDFLL